MKKEEIIHRLSQMSETDLNQVLTVYRKHGPKKANGQQVITIPEHIKNHLFGFGSDSELSRIIKDFPTCLTPIEAPSKALAEKCKQTYIDHCFCFDETGEVFVQKVLEYAASYQIRPLILHGSPGCGKSHRASVLASMLGLPYERTDIPLSSHSSGLSGEGGSYKNASLGIVAQGMYKTQSCNYILNSEELDKEERIEGRPSFSDQFLKVLDQDATRFRDNRLGFEIDASHIVYVFTANDKTKISAPMLDRCDVLELSPPSRSEIENIVRGAVIPKAIGNLRSSSEISFSEEAVDFILRSLWRGDDTSIRQYQSLISKCVSAANYICICEERPVIIQASDAEMQLKRMSSITPIKNRIGFI